MIAASIVGFLVVRLPQWNYDGAKRGVYRGEPPRLGEIGYEGIDRMSWFDVDEDYYTGSLPGRLRDQRDQIKEENPDLTGICVTKEFNVAKSLLDYSNREGVRNEIIGVRSPKLAQLKGEVAAIEAKIEWIGYDVIDLGHWSLLSEGVFLAPDYFPEWSMILNRHGLLTDCSKVQDLTEGYNNAVKSGKVEELAPSVYGIDAIEIGRVLYSLA